MSAKKNEEVRNSVIEHLAARRGILQTADTILRKLKVENPDFDVADIQAALLFLKDKGFVANEVDELGSTLYYRATADGITFIERKYGI